MTSEQEHMDRVARLGCIVCMLNGYGQTPALVHHILTGRTPGRKSDDWLTIPLCHEHHQGMTGIHTMQPEAFKSMHGWSELQLLAKTLARIYG